VLWLLVLESRLIRRREFRALEGREQTRLLPARIVMVVAGQRVEGDAGLETLRHGVRLTRRALDVRRVDVRQQFDGAHLHLAWLRAFDANDLEVDRRLDGRTDFIGRQGEAA